MHSYEFSSFKTVRYDVWAVKLSKLDRHFLIVCYNLKYPEMSFVQSVDSKERIRDILLALPPADIAQDD